MTRRRVEIQSTLSESEKRIARRYLRYDRTAKLYAPQYGEDNIFDAVKHAMLDMHRTFQVRYTHVQSDGTECPCFSSAHADGR